jgi:hypothetical protein
LLLFCPCEGGIGGDSDLDSVVVGWVIGDNESVTHEHYGCMLAVLL